MAWARNCVSSPPCRRWHHDAAHRFGWGRSATTNAAGKVWWSNGVDSGRINADNTDHPWVPPAPATCRRFCRCRDLPAGTYRVAITHAMADGEESVASDIETITLASAGAITLTLPAATAGADAFNIYRTTTNGKVLQQYSTVAAATASVSITAAPQGRQPGTVHSSSRYRLERRSVSRRAPALPFREFIYYSKPHDYGVHDPAQDYIIVLGAAGSIMASVESGLFVAADRTWFYAGADIAAADPTERLAFGAVAGTAFIHPTSAPPVAGWYSDEGLCSAQVMAASRSRSAQTGSSRRPQILAQRGSDSATGRRM